MGNSFVQTLPNVQVDLKKYLGVWHEIARTPSWFEHNLVGVTATYTLKDDGKTVEVWNQGYDFKCNMKHKESKGMAVIPDPSKPGRLRVSFFPPISADYVICGLSEDYQFALVGSSRNSFWILSRKPEMSDTDYGLFVHLAANLGFNVDKLTKIPQFEKKKNKPI